MKKKISLQYFALATSTGAFAQDARSAMNQILDGYTLPIFVAVMLWRKCLRIGSAMGQYYRQG